MAGSILAGLSMLLSPRSGKSNSTWSNNKLEDQCFTSVEGNKFSLSDFAGQVILIVNTASGCGFKSQFNELESLYRKYREDRFIVLGVPSNDFGNQEPDDNLSICENYRNGLKLSFPITRKAHVKGPNSHPFFLKVKSIAGNHASPKWSFYKYLINRENELVAWFATMVKPQSTLIEPAIRNQLNL